MGWLEQWDRNADLDVAPTLHLKSILESQREKCTSLNELQICRIACFISEGQTLQMMNLQTGKLNL